MIIIFKRLYHLFKQKHIGKHKINIRDAKSEVLTAVVLGYNAV
jgi:hypothetical protein